MAYSGPNPHYRYQRWEETPFSGIRLTGEEAVAYLEQRRAEDRARDMVRQLRESENSRREELWSRHRELRRQYQPYDSPPLPEKMILAADVGADFALAKQRIFRARTSDQIKYLDETAHGLMEAVALFSLNFPANNRWVVPEKLGTTTNADYSRYHERGYGSIQVEFRGSASGLLVGHISVDDQYISTQFSNTGGYFDDDIPVTRHIFGNTVRTYVTSGDYKHRLQSIRNEAVQQAWVSFIADACERNYINIRREDIDPTSPRAFQGHAP